MNRRQSTSRKAADWLVIAMFLSATTLPAGRSLIGARPPTERAENRQLESMPPLGPRRELLVRFPAQFEAFYQDHFGLRNILLRWLHMTEVVGLHVSSSPKVVLGKDGWLFLTE